MRLAQKRWASLMQFFVHASKKKTPTLASEVEVSACTHPILHQGLNGMGNLILSSLFRSIRHKYTEWLPHR